MVTLEDIQRQTGVSINTIQYWRRRQNEGLLPEPVAVRRKVIYFDDSIMERIRFIKERLDEGVKLPDIKEMLHQKDEEEAIANYNPYEQDDDDGGRYMDAVAKLQAKWTKSDCKNDICLALALDPAISGYPSLSVFTEITFYGPPVEVFVSIVSNGWVHFAKLNVHIGGVTEVKVADSAKIKVSDYGMLLAIIGQRLAEDNQLLSPSDIPSILFGAYDMDEWRGVFSLETLEEAKTLTKILRAGKEFMRNF
ncbi:helix-turn-helix domain-containing protein [Deltaproteobacteria bacterium OttesenSCG-928-M10]|nr:helix-turn-helix domain-containing protein [Deltaproteobacteria bacterium OttesenSCG-928-M10]